MFIILEEKRRKMRSDVKIKMEQEGDFHTFIHEGYHCAVMRSELGTLCGYVALPPEHCLYGYSHGDEVKVSEDILNKKVNTARVNVLVLFAYCLKKHADRKTKNSDEIEVDTAPISVILPVHGGINYSSDHLYDVINYTVEDKADVLGGTKAWWFGFDCGHKGDYVPKLHDLAKVSTGEASYRDMEFVIDECKQLVDQLKDFKLEK